MQLGCFSVSLAVKDIAKSRAFYEQLGFSVIHGDQTQNWLIMGNESTKIGLFQGMFEHNILTFNPGWSPTAEALESFDDIRDIQRQLKANGTAFESEADESSTGPANLVVRDPDGNLIMLDQHVAKAT